MNIGVPKEVKNHEYRVGLTPGGVHELTQHGHKVWVQSTAGEQIGFSDQDYLSAGAIISSVAEEVWENAELIIKVKEPIPSEYLLIRAKHTLFTYLHLAANETLTDALLHSGCTAFAYETLKGSSGDLPLLAPMSQVAGRMSIQAGAHCLEIAQGGRGVLLGGVPGVLPAKVVVLGGGVVGSNAAQMALGLGADTTIIDKSPARLQALDEQFNGRVKTLFSTKENIHSQVNSADLVIGAVLIPGAAAPKLVTQAHLQEMNNGSVIVDVAIDQGGCFATSKATTHQDPTYVSEGVVHYCVANMPGAVARTSTLALTNATLPYIEKLAKHGSLPLIKTSAEFASSLNIHAGNIYCSGVASAFQRPLIPIDQLE